MKIFTVHFEGSYSPSNYDLEAEKVEFDWATRTAVFLIGEEVVGSAVDWRLITSMEAE